MRFKHIVLGAALASLVGGSVLVSQASADTLIPLFTYRTGPFANSGIPIANGMHDYIDHAERARRRHRRRQNQVRRVRDRLQEREGRRML